MFERGESETPAYEPSDPRRPHTLGHAGVCDRVANMRGGAMELGAQGGVGGRGEEVKSGEKGSRGREKRPGEKEVRRLGPGTV